MLVFELNAPEGDTVSGMVVMPFGLALDSSVTLQVNDKPAMPELRFRTCLPGTFDAPVGR